jgi:predicted HicB family RNase H-like nuclease
MSNQTRTLQFNMRLTDAERRRLTAIARARGLSVTAWLRQLITLTPIKPHGPHGTGGNGGAQ